MTSKGYDLFRRVQGQARWLETFTDFNQAIARMNRLALDEPGEYVVFDQKTFLIVGSTEPPLVGRFLRPPPEPRR